MGQRVIALLLGLAALALAGCGEGPSAAPPSAGEGATAEKEGKAAQGMSRSNLSVPNGSENVNLPGSKGGQ